MDLKNIKDILRRPTKRRLKILDPAKFIDPASPELKNTYLKGRQFEDFAVEILIKHHWKLKSRNQRYYGVEIDAVFESPQGVLSILEFKSIKQQNSETRPLREKQLQRLLQVARGFAETLDQRVDLLLGTGRRGIQPQFYLWNGESWESIGL